MDVVYGMSFFKGQFFDIVTLPGNLVLLFRFDVSPKQVVQVLVLTTSPAQFLSVSSPNFRAQNVLLFVVTSAAFMRLNSRDTSCSEHV